MIFRHQMLERNLEWVDGTHLCELIIENPRFLRRVLRELSAIDEESSLSFSDNGKNLTLEKEIDVIFNPLKLDFNNRRAMTTLLKLLVKSSLSESFYLETGKLKTKIIKYLGELIDSENYNFEVVTDEFGIDDLAKATSLHIVGDEDDFVELLIDYMAMMAELAGIKLFIFVNLRTMLSPEELTRLQHNLANHQLNVLLVESIDRGKIDDTQRILVDRDQCEI